MDMREEHSRRQDSDIQTDPDQPASTDQSEVPTPRQQLLSRALEKLPDVYASGQKLLSNFENLCNNKEEITTSYDIISRANKLHINLFNVCKKLNGFISAFLILFIFSPFAYAYISITETGKRTDYMGKEIATKIQFAWSKNYKEPINIVLGDEWVAGNLSYHLKARPIWYGPITKDKLNLLTKFMCIDSICVGNR